MSEPEGPQASDNHIEGERGIASVNAARSLQTRVSNLLAMGLMSTLAVGLLGWYYAHTFATRGEVKRAAENRSRDKAQGEMALPSLGRIDPPAAAAPPLSPPLDPPLAVVTPTAPAAVTSLSAPTTPAEKSPEELALERRLGGPVSQGPQTSGTGASTTSQAPKTSPEPTESPLASWLHPSAIASASAHVLPAERLLLPKGAFIDCTLETAIDSTLPGMTTCITATDTFGVD
jgi:type IV secretion system protein VirB10